MSDRDQRSEMVGIAVYPDTKEEWKQAVEDDPNAARGIRSRGMVKSGNQANALYLIGSDESVEEWGYTEDRRQDGPVSRS